MSGGRALMELSIGSNALETNRIPGNRGFADP
jgi:hypothetical protein